MELRFLHSALPLMTFKFHLIGLYIFRDDTHAPDMFLIAKVKKGNNCINIGDRVTVLTFCIYLYGRVSVYQVSLNYLQYF